MLNTGWTPGVQTPAEPTFSFLCSSLKQSPRPRSADSLPGSKTSLASRKVTAAAQGTGWKPPRPGIKSRLRLFAPRAPGPGPCPSRSLCSSPQREDHGRGRVKRQLCISHLGSILSGHTGLPGAMSRGVGPGGPGRPEKGKSTLHLPQVQILAPCIQGPAPHRLV